MRWFNKKFNVKEDELKELEYSMINLKLLKLGFINKTDEFNDSKYDDLIKNLEDETERISEILAKIRYRLA